MSSVNILLFDIDGVLVRPKGYRRAYRDTVNSFLKEFGLERLELTSNHFAESFEAVEIPAEWDMVPLTLAMIFDYLLSLDPSLTIPRTLKDARPLITLSGDQNGFSAYFERMLPILRAHMDGPSLPVQTLYRAIQRGDSPDRLLPYIRREALLSNIFSDSLNITTSLPLQRLEAYLLGSDVFRDTFGVSCPDGIVSVLETCDEPLLSEAYRERIRVENGKTVFVAGMTARPDRLDRSFPDSLLNGFGGIPEAECALETLGWRDGDAIRLIGCTSLETVENWLGVPTDTYLKPHPVHALSAFITALNVKPFLAIVAAQAYLEGDDPSLLLGMLNKNCVIRLAVVEDSAIGIRSANVAVEHLRRDGYKIEYFPYGVQTADGKNEMLAKAGAKPVASVNEAIADFLPDWD